MATVEEIMEELHRQKAAAEQEFRRQQDINRDLVRELERYKKFGDKARMERLIEYLKGDNEFIADEANELREQLMALNEAIRAYLGFTDKKYAVSNGLMKAKSERRKRLLEHLNQLYHDRDWDDR